MSMTDGYWHHDRGLQYAIGEINLKIFRQQLKHLQRQPNYPSHAWRKGIGLFTCIDRAPANHNADLRVAYCSSGKITYLDALSFYRQKQEYLTLLDNAYSGIDTLNQYKAPHEFLVDKINSAPKA